MKILRFLLRIFLWLAVAALGCIICFYLALLYINRADEPPSPAARQLASVIASRPVVADSDNAYVYLLGMTVPEDQAPAEWGQRRMDWAREVTAGTAQGETDGQYLEWPGLNYDSWRAKGSLFVELRENCKTPDPECLGWIENNSQRIRDFALRHHWLIARYRSLQNYESWREITPYDLRLPFPGYSEVVSLSRLYYANWLASADRNDESVVQALDNELRFWRRLLTDSDVLVSKMFAVVGVHHTLEWAAAIYSQLRSVPFDEGRSHSMHIPLSEKERSMERAMAGEWEFVQHNIDALYELEQYGEPAAKVWLKRQEWRVLQPLFKPQATYNQFATEVLAETVALNQPYELLPSALEAFDQAASCEKRQRQGLCFSMYNPAGRMLLSVFTTDVSGYGTRVADLEGLRRLVLLTADLYANDVSLSEVAEAVTASAWNNPYTNEPFEWEAAEQRLIFRGLARKDEGIYQLWYRPAAPAQETEGADSQATVN